MITALTIAGHTVDLRAVVAASVTVIHGRGAFDDRPTASSADLTLLVPETAGLPGWSSGDLLTLATEHGPLFTGTIADRRIAGHVDTVERGRCAQLELMCAGLLAAAGWRLVGDEPWPQETGSARAQRILDLAGLPSQVTPAPAVEVQVLPRDVDRQPAGTLLDELARDTGAAVVDLPDGRILYQPLEARSRPIFNVRWQDLPAADLWSDFTPTMMWSDFDYLSPSAAAPVDLPPSAVEAEPQWVASAATIVNRITVAYGPLPEGEEQASVDVVDAPSIDRYGERYAHLATQLATQTDAQTRGVRVIATQAAERWQLGDVTVWESQLDPTQRGQVAALVCGDWVQIRSLPQPAPAQDWAGIVEGWAYRETRTSAAHHTWRTLMLSDPLHSLAVMTWADFTPTMMWSDFPPGVLWADLTTPANIGG